MTISKLAFTTALLTSLTTGTIAQASFNFLDCPELTGEKLRVKNASGAINYDRAYAASVQVGGDTVEDRDDDADAADDILGFEGTTEARAQLTFDGLASEELIDYIKGNMENNGLNTVEDLITTINMFIGYKGETQPATADRLFVTLKKLGLTEDQANNPKEMFSIENIIDELAEQIGGEGQGLVQRVEELHHELGENVSVNGSAITKVGALNQQVSEQETLTDGVTALHTILSTQFEENPDAVQKVNIVLDDVSRHFNNHSFQWQQPDQENQVQFTTLLELKMFIEGLRAQEENNENPPA